MAATMQRAGKGREEQKLIDLADGDSDHFEQAGIDNPSPGEAEPSSVGEEGSQWACLSATNILQLDKNKRGY